MPRCLLLVQAGAHASKHRSQCSWPGRRCHASWPCIACMHWVRDACTHLTHRCDDCLHPSNLHWYIPFSIKWWSAFLHACIICACMHACRAPSPGLRAFPPLHTPSSTSSTGVASTSTCFTACSNTCIQGSMFALKRLHVSFLAHSKQDHHVKQTAG